MKDAIQDAVNRINIHPVNTDVIIDDVYNVVKDHIREIIEQIEHENKFGEPFTADEILSRIKEDLL